MKKNAILLLLLLITFSTTSFGQNTKTFISDKLVIKWATPQELKVPESACFDKQRNIIYVSNIAGESHTKDNIGFISKVTPDGKIKILEWVTGLSAPKGMGIYGNMLYISDIDRVVGIDIAKGKIVKTWDIPNAKFLNDIAVSNEGTVYVSDMQDSAVYQIQDGKLSLLVRSGKLNGPNGLYAENGYLLAGLQDRVVKIDLMTKEITEFIAKTGGIDGLVPEGNGNYLISDWQGHVYEVSPGKERILLLDTTPDKINAADISYVIGEKMLLVPTFLDNRVVAYTLK
jgi:sugar lactone lactonase YvrE